jgi:hypothetical protein
LLNESRTEELKDKQATLSDAANLPSMTLQNIMIELDSHIIDGGKIVCDTLKFLQGETGQKLALTASADAQQLEYAKDVRRRL